LSHHWRNEVQGGRRVGHLLEWSEKTSKVDVRRLSILAYTGMYGRVQSFITSAVGTVTTLYTHTHTPVVRWMQIFCTPQGSRTSTITRSKIHHVLCKKI
jgi:hypothetical protein